MRKDLIKFLENIREEKIIESILCNMNNDEITLLFENLEYKVSEEAKDRWSSIYYIMTQNRE